MFKYVSLAVLGGVLLHGVACSGGGPIEEETPVGGVTEVLVKGNKYSPRVIEVKPGTEVTWTFGDDHEHDVVADGWGSKRMKSGSFTHRFDTPGIYDYRCSLHGNMTGRIVVKEG